MEKTEPKDLQQARLRVRERINRYVLNIFTAMGSAAVIYLLGKYADHLVPVNAFPFPRAVIGPSSVAIGLAMVGLAAYLALKLFLDYGGIIRATYQDNTSVYELDTAQQFRLINDSEPSIEEILQSVRKIIASGEPDSDVPDKPTLSNHDILAREMRGRLRAEISNQGRKANVNLSVGIIVASAAVGFLAWQSIEALLMAQQKSDITPMLYWGGFGAKLALSITANVFAFFFLSTYRRNLSEIKYFQNELTNVESKLIAMSIADTKQETEVREVIRSLLAVERNFILKKGETTADLSLKDLDRTEVNALVTLATRALQSAHHQKRTGDESGC